MDKMRKVTIKTFVVAVLFLVTTCNKIDKKDDLELLLLNNDLICYSKNSKKDSINIIKYSLKNNSDKIYFINNLTDQRELSKRAIYKNGVNLLIYDNKNIEIKYEIMRYLNGGLEAETCINFMMEDFKRNEHLLGNNIDLKYFGLYERNNMFFIHPNEIIYFQYSINLNRPTSFDAVREGFVSLNRDKDYFSKLSIASDSLNYKYVLPRDILQTIKRNNVKVYHGIIESKNLIPVKVID